MERTSTVDVLRCAMEDSGAQCVGRMSPVTWPLLHVDCWDLVLKVKRRKCAMLRHVCTHMYMHLHTRTWLDAHII